MEWQDFQVHLACEPSKQASTHWKTKHVEVSCRKDWMIKTSYGMSQNLESWSTMQLDLAGRSTKVQTILVLTHSHIAKELRHAAL